MYNHSIKKTPDRIKFYREFFMLIRPTNDFRFRMADRLLRRPE